MTKPGLDPRVDAYLSTVAPFALPVLEHLRELVHKGCPGVEETMKWSRPFFVYRGAILGNMSAFKEHCSFGFWGEEIAGSLREAKALKGDGMGSLGRITSVKDLPSDKLMLGWIRQAVALVDKGEYTSPIAARRRVVKEPKPMVEAPAELMSALKRDKKAAAVFDGFSPSARREYIDWVVEAKRPETREKRIATAVEWIAEGKQRNWKYQNC